jgi:hypothetical protein
MLWGFNGVVNLPFFWGILILVTKVDPAVISRTGSVRRKKVCYVSQACRMHSEVSQNDDEATCTQDNA